MNTSEVKCVAFEKSLVVAALAMQREIQKGTFVKNNDVMYLEYLLVRVLDDVYENLAKAETKRYETY